MVGLEGEGKRTERVEEQDASVSADKMRGRDKSSLPQTMTALALQMLPHSKANPGPLPVRT